MSVVDRPGVLAARGPMFGEQAVSIRTVLQKGGRRGQPGPGAALGPRGAGRAAMEGCAALDDVRGEPVLLRVLGSGEGGA